MCECISFSFWMMQCCFIESQNHIHHRIIFISFMLQREEESSMGSAQWTLHVTQSASIHRKRKVSAHIQSHSERGKHPLMYFAHPNPCYWIWQVLITACTRALWEEMGCMGMMEANPSNVSPLWMVFPAQRPTTWAPSCSDFPKENLIFAELHLSPPDTSSLFQLRKWEDWIFLRLHQEMVRLDIGNISFCKE